MWEDSANRRGGKWMVRLRKGIASRYWEDLVRDVELEELFFFAAEISADKTSRCVGAGYHWRAIRCGQRDLRRCHFGPVQRGHHLALEPQR